MANLWPDTPPPISTPHPMPFDEITPRNCMPSLHTAWATAIFIHSRKGPRFLRFAGTFWLIATLGATLGFGYHYGVDLVAGVVFTLTIEAALRSLDRGWDRSGIRLVAYGATVFAALLVSYRYLPMEMADIRGCSDRCSFWRWPQWSTATYGPPSGGRRSPCRGRARSHTRSLTRSLIPEPSEPHPERHPELVRVPQPPNRSRSSPTSAKNHV